MCREMGFLVRSLKMNGSNDLLEWPRNDFTVEQLELESIERHQTCLALATDPSLYVLTRGAQSL